jgi:hypothetical protein
MSRREIAINTLLGSVLILIFACSFAAAFAAIVFASRAINIAVKHFLPGMAHSGNVAFYGFFGILLLISGIGDLRKRRWRNAFLSFAAVALILSIVFASPDSMFGLSGSLAIFAILPVLGIPADSSPTRPQFLGGASIVFFVVALNAGLLGSGTLARIVADCVLVGAFLWFAIDVRRRWSVINAEPQASHSPTHA